jgi:hypothetical protein
MIIVRKIIYRRIKWTGCTVCVVQMGRATAYTRQIIHKENATLRLRHCHVTVISVRNVNEL